MPKKQKQNLTEDFKRRMRNVQRRVARSSTSQQILKRLAGMAAHQAEAGIVVSILECADNAERLNALIQQRQSDSKVLRRSYSYEDFTERLSKSRNKVIS